MAGENNRLAKGYGGSAQWVAPFQLIDESGTVQFGVAADGTLTIPGATAIDASGALNVVGNLSVATNKFTVASASGNTVVAGTLAVTGASTLTGAVTITAAKPIIGATATPASNGAGTAGMLTWDGSYLYICTASNTWARVAVTGGY